MNLALNLRTFILPLNNLVWTLLKARRGAQEVLSLVVC